MGTKLMLNNLNGFKTVAWGSCMVDAGTARELKFMSKVEKVPVPVRHEWVDGHFHIFLSIETIDEEAHLFDVCQGKHNWQVLIKVDPKKPKYLTVTTAIAPHSFVVDRINRLQKFYLGLVTDQPVSLLPGCRWIIPYMHGRNPPFYTDASGEQKTERKNEISLSEEQMKKLLAVVATAFSTLQGEGELRLMTMATIANRFGISIPDEAITAANAEEMNIKLQREAAKATFPEPSAAPGGASSSSGSTGPKKEEPGLKNEPKQEESGNTGVGGAEFIIVDDPTTETVKQEQGGPRVFVPAQN